MRYVIWIGSVAASGLLALASSCSASDANGGSANTGGAGGSDASGLGGSGAAATGGAAGVTIDAGVKDTGSPDACASISAKANRPEVDIIWVIDNSSSMWDEIDKVHKNINQAFVPIIDKSILDWQVIMISKRGSKLGEVCVQPPLAGANCADNPPKFHQISCVVGSSSSLSVAFSSYKGTVSPLVCDSDAKPWNKLARFDATKVFVEVTDDEAGPATQYMTAGGFDYWALNSAQPPGMFGTEAARKYIFHAIVGMDKANPSVVCKSGGNEAEAPGIEYQHLAKLTGGITRSICEDDWSDIFTSIAGGIVSRLSCEYAPTPPGGQSLDPNQVNVSFTPGGGSPEAILQDNNKPCDQGADGWQWDPTKTRILLCGASCDKVKADLGGQIDLEFGCATKLAPPR